MKTKLKKLNQQVVVITGASSGIGLATARMAARKGARLVLASRNEKDLQSIVREIHENKGEAVPVVADVSRFEDVDQIARVAQDKFGGFDTWINNASSAIYGELTEVPLNEKHRVFDVDFWGTVYGCRAAVRILKNRGGAIINIGSVVSDRAIPLQGIYVAAKHAVKGYTDVLRMELEANQIPISVTLVKPGSIDTPYIHHAKNRMDMEPSYPPPVYSPDVVARTILFCAENPKRDVYVGGAAKVLSVMGKLAPRLTDFYMERNFFRQQKMPSSQSRQKEPEHQEGLFGAPAHEGQVHGGHPGYVSSSSLFTFFSLRPRLSLAAFSGLAAMTIGLIARNRKRKKALNQPEVDSILPSQASLEERKFAV